MGSLATINYKTRVSSFKRGGKTCYIANPILNGVVLRDEFLENIARKSGLDKHLVDFVEKLLEDEMKETFLEGKRLELDNIACGINIQGRFDSVDEDWDASRHKMVANIHLKGELAKCLDKVKGTNVKKSGSAMFKSVIDFKNKTESVLVSEENNLVYVAGSGLMTSTDPTTGEGVWIEDCDTGEIAAVGKVTKSTETTLDAFFVTMPPPGKYRFVVATRSGRSEECGAKKACRRISVISPITHLAKKSR